ncbi:MAG: hypothetical protein EAS51_02495 [Microbacteriaceae bacterium]|nr:MAG: hypothetical protein EAS51_02495 [Microbacteriaceae bacterium]
MPRGAISNVRFGDHNTGHDIIHFTYGDGALYQPDPGFPGRSVLMIDVTVTGDYDLTGAADPSVLSGLRTIEEAAPSATQAAALGGTAGLLTLLVARPGYLVDTVLDRRWAQLRAWWRTRRARPAARPARRQPRWLVWPGFAAAAIVRRIQPDAQPRITFRWGSLPLALLPLAALDGAIVFAWRKLVWFLVYLVGVAAFGLVTFTVPEAWTEVGDDYLRWVLVFVVFAVVATGAWALDVRLERRKLRRVQERGAQAVG